MNAEPRAAHPKRTRVWDVPVRVLHGVLALTVVAGLLTGYWMADRRIEYLHHVLGYTAGAVVIIRVIWGFVGSRYARFAQFVRAPREVWLYARLLAGGREPRHLGHNPLGGWMVVVLLAGVGAASLTGILYTTDWLWGWAWLELLHSGLAWLCMIAICCHVAGVAFTGWRHHENLVTAMWTGDKRPDAEDKV